MTFISAAEAKRLRRNFMRLVRTSEAATTMTLKRETEKSGTGIDLGTDETTLATAVPILAEQLHSATRRDTEVTMAGHVKAGEWNIMAPVYADVTWVTGLAAALKKYEIDDLLTLADGTLLKIKTEAVDAVGHFEFIATPRN